MKTAFDTINTAASGDYTISLNANITLGVGVGSLSIPQDCTVTLLGNGHTINFASSSVALGTTGGILNLGNEDKNKLTIDASGIYRSSSLFAVVGGTVNMYEGVALTVNDNTNKTTHGGGVSVENATGSYDSVFNMYSGVISGCKNR